jgi:hypothetical protein
VFLPSVVVTSRSHNGSHCPRLSTAPFFGAVDVDISHEPVLTLAEYCLPLEGVVLTNAQSGDEDITALVRGCPKLKRLSITGMRATTLGLLAIRDHCKNLEWLFLAVALYPDGRGEHAFFSAKVVTLFAVVF